MGHTEPMVLEQLAAESLAPTACSTIVFIARTGSAKSQKIYYYCNVFVCGFATMSYFSMLSGQGWTAIAGCRQFFYARYVDWSITTPLLLLDLGLIAGADGALIAAAIGADLIMIVAGYLGAVSVVTTVKWFWFVIAMSMFSLCCTPSQSHSARLQCRGVPRLPMCTARWLG